MDAAGATGGFGGQRSSGANLEVGNGWGRAGGRVVSGGFGWKGGRVEGGVFF